MLNGHEGQVECVTLAPGGSIIASGGQDKTIKLWDVATGKELRTITGHTNFIVSVAFTVNGKILLSGSDDNSVKLWDVTTGNERNTFKIITIQVHGAAITGDGSTVAVASGSLTGNDTLAELYLIDVATAKQRKFTDPKTDRRSVAFSSDGMTLATGNDDGVVKIWNVVSGQEKNVLKGHTGMVSSLAFTTDGNTLVSGSYDGAVKLWNLATGSERTTLRSGKSRTVTSVAVTQDGSFLVAGSTDGTVTLWGGANSNPLLTFEAHKGQVNSVAISPDGKTLVSAGGAIRKPGEVKVWDVTIGKEMK